MSAIHPEELPVQAGYAAWAETYDGDGNPLTALEEPAMWSRFGPLAGKTAVDIGCGTGRHTRALIEAGAARVVALDFTPEMMARGRAKLAGMPIDWVQHRLPDSLPFAEGSFDLIVMGLVVEHVAQLDLVMAEAYRVARPGAACLVSALHPDRTAAGQTARFIDPATGVRRPIRTVHRTLDDYLFTARAAGWDLIEDLTLVGTPELTKTHPRAVPYLGQPLGWVGHWVRG